MKNKVLSIIPNEILYIIITLLGIYFVFYLIVPSEETIMKRERLDAEAKNRWIKSFKDRGINTISFALNREYMSEVIDHGDRWRRIDRIYVNNIPIAPDSLYNKEEFIIKNCDNLYYILSGGNIDSVIYQFSPKKLFLEHRIDDNLFSVSDNLIINKSLNIKYKRYLPKCWD